MSCKHLQYDQVGYKDKANIGGARAQSPVPNLKPPKTKRPKLWKGTVPA